MRTRTALRREHAATTVEVQPDALRALRARVLDNDFVVERRLEDYAGWLGSAFLQRLGALGRGGHWIDMGAGAAHAINDYLAIVPEQAQPRVTAVGVTVPPGTVRNSRYRYLEGRVLSDYSVDEIGQADLITDFFGPGVYAGALDQTIEQYGHLLRPGGDLFLIVGRHVTINGVPFGMGGDRARIQHIVRRWMTASSGFDFIPSADGLSIHLRRNADPVRIASLRLAEVDPAAVVNDRLIWQYRYRFVPDHVRSEAARHGNE